MRMRSIRDSTRTILSLATLDPGSLDYTPEKMQNFYARLIARVRAVAAE